MSDGKLLEGSAGETAAAEPSRPLVGAPKAPERWARAILVRPGHGVRAIGPGDLQVVCDTGLYSVDAVLQRRNVPGWCVVGQVFRFIDQPAADMEIVLHADRQPVEVAQTDAFGEFTFMSRPARRLGLALRGPELALIELWRWD